MITSPTKIRPSLREIKDIFPNANGVGLCLPEIGRGLKIRFNTRANFFDELGCAEPSKKISCRPLFELAAQYGFLVLENCTAIGISENDYSRLSSGHNQDGRFIQDPFHYDHIDGMDDFAACIYTQNDNGREEDTLYALESDVREAILSLPRVGLSYDVIDALDKMGDPSYRFRLFQNDDSLTRHVIKHDYPEFVSDVFARIPPTRTFRKKWLKGVWDMTIDGNIFGDIVHARPTGHAMVMGEAPDNPLRGLYITR